MALRNGPDGYGSLTKVLHWLTVLLLAAQVSVGLLMDPEADEPDCDPPGEDRSGGDTTDAYEERLDRIEEACEDRADLWARTTSRATTCCWCTVLGTSVIALGLVRILWRRQGSLPAWSEALGPRARRVAAVTEKVLLAGLLVVPASGLLLVLSGDDHWVPLHVGAMLAFAAALVVHLATNLRPAVLRRMT